MEIRIVSWNIAGCRKIASVGTFSYSAEDIGYFSDVLRRIGPDFVCLQESHMRADGSDSVAARLAGALGMEVAADSASSPSHIDPAFCLSIAVLSRMIPRSVSVRKYPAPRGPLILPDGRIGTVHAKAVQSLSFGSFSVANTQMFPIGLFGLSYDDGDRGSALAREMDTVLRDVIAPPAVFCGDFNTEDPLGAFPCLGDMGCLDALPDMPTKPSKTGRKFRPDHILYTPGIRVIDADVLPAETDHFPCVVRLGMP